MTLTLLFRKAAPALAVAAIGGLIEMRVTMARMEAEAIDTKRRVERIERLVDSGSRYSMLEVTPDVQQEEDQAR